MPKDLTHLVKSHSSRGGATIQRIVLHTTEGHNRPGVSDLTGLAEYFDGVEASSHLGIDAEGNCIRMVKDEDKAWTQMAYNPTSLSIEQIGFAATSRADWMKAYYPGLVRVAQALAHWSLSHPQIKLHHSVDDGICQHKDLGEKGGGHDDCGPGYPEDYVITLARIHYYKHKGWNELPAGSARRKTLAGYYDKVHQAEKKYIGHTVT